VSYLLRYPLLMTISRLIQDRYDIYNSFGRPCAGTGELKRLGEDYDVYKGLWS
jgi:hypothetical protein